MPLDVTQTLCELVRIPSVNPMGRDVSGAEYLEAAMTDHLEDVFRKLNLPFERQRVERGRENIVARLDGRQDPLEGGPLIVLEAHQDTVPVDGMTIPPWSPQVSGGKVSGRGACDIKGGMACMLSALARLADERPENMPCVVMACSVNEEHGYSGAMELAASWRDGRSKLVPRVPDAVIVAEPTELNVVVAHKGVSRWKCSTAGRAAHSSMPHLGENAIYRMGRVLRLLDNYATESAPQLGNHPLVGHPTLSVGVISGGISVNTVPDCCAIEIDRRVLPGENPDEARAKVIDYLSSELGTDEPHVRHAPPFISAGGLSDGQNGEIADRLTDVMRKLGQTASRSGVPYGTDAPAFDGIGAPTVVFGPGSIDQAHTCDEWVAVEQLQQASEAYYRLVTSYSE